MMVPAAVMGVLVVIHCAVAVIMLAAYMHPWRSSLNEQEYARQSDRHDGFAQQIHGALHFHQLRRSGQTGFLDS